MNAKWDKTRYMKGHAVKTIEFKLPAKRLPEFHDKCGLKEGALMKAFEESFGTTPDELTRLGRQVRYGHILVRCTAEQFTSFIILRARYGAENWIAELDANHTDACRVSPGIFLDVTNPLPGTTYPFPSDVKMSGKTYPLHGATEDKYGGVDDLDELDRLTELRAREFAAAMSGDIAEQEKAFEAFVAGARKYGRSPFTWKGNPTGDSWVRDRFENPPAPKRIPAVVQLLLREMAHAITPGGLLSSAGMVDWKRRAEDALSMGKVASDHEAAAFKAAVDLEVKLRIQQMTKDVRKDTLREVMDLIRDKYRAARAELSGRYPMRQNQLVMQKIMFLKRVGSFFLANFYSETDTKAWKRETSNF
jgi:hypothetical protein